MPTTITAYTTFQANSKARATQVNTNFSNHRGTLVPINTDTATASNLTHDLGTTEHRWKTGYIKEVYFGQTTTSWRVYDNTASAGDLIFEKNGTELFRLSSTNSDATFSSAVSTQSINTSAATLVTNFDITIAAYGRPIEIKLIPDMTTTSLDTWVQLASPTSTNTSAYLYLVRDGTTLSGSAIEDHNTNANSRTTTWPWGSFAWVDTPSAGNVTYKVSAKLSVPGGNATLWLRYGRMMVRRL